MGRDAELREVHQVRIGKTGALVRWPLDSPARAPVAVILCPGHPASCSASSPLIAALDIALALAGVPVVRFDYVGVGMSSDDQHPGTLQSGWGGVDRVSSSLLDVIPWVKRKLGHRIILCCHSFGTAVAVNTMKTHGVQVEALILISAGISAPLYLEGSPYKKDLETIINFHRMLSLPILYVVGARDPATPLEKLLEMVGERTDCGDGVSIEVIREGSHDMRGKESEVATLATEWVVNLQDELLSLQAESIEKESAIKEPADGDYEIDNGDQRVMFDLNGDILGVVDIDNRIRGGCSSLGCSCFNPPTGVLGRTLLRTCLRCGALNTEHEDKGLGEYEEDMRPIRVTCLKTSHARSLSKFFHIKLPHGADVADLRNALGQCLPPLAQVLKERPGRSPQALQDSDFLPSSALVSEFTGAITPAMIFTKSQLQDLQVSVRDAVKKPQSQRRIDEIEKSSGGSEMAFRFKLAAFLGNEVYPGVLKQLEFNPQDIDVTALPKAFSTMDQDLEFAEIWLETETLMRNRSQMAIAKAALDAAHEKQRSNP